MAESKRQEKWLLREYTESFVIAVVLALALRFFVISAYKIPTGSMVPTLKVGDFIFAYKLPYGIQVPFVDGLRLAERLPERGDVIVFRFPGNENINYVKRVVGLPGDRILIKARKLLINGAESSYEALSKQMIEDLPGNEFYNVYAEGIAARSHLILKSDDGGDEEFGPIVVPPGHVFVLGDNRDTSDDSRYWGAVPMKNVEGRVILIWMSFDWQNRWGSDRLPRIRWDRVLQAVR